MLVPDPLLQNCQIGRVLFGSMQKLHTACSVQDLLVSSLQNFRCMLIFSFFFFPVVHCSLYQQPSVGTFWVRRYMHRQRCCVTSRLLNLLEGSHVTSTEMLMLCSGLSSKMLPLLLPCWIKESWPRSLPCLQTLSSMLAVGRSLCQKKKPVRNRQANILHCFFPNDLN